MSLKKLSVDLPILKSQPQSLGKIRRQPGPKSKQKDLASKEVLDLGALANVSMSVVKETVSQFAAAQAEQQAAAQRQFAGKNKPKNVPSATITSANQVDPPKQTKRKLESATEGPAPKKTSQYLFEVSDDEDDTLDTGSEAPSSLISDQTGDQSEKSKASKVENKRLWGRITRLTKSLNDAEKLVTLSQEHTKVLEHTVSDLQGRLAKKDQECEELKAESKEVKAKLSSATELQRAAQRELDSYKGRIEQLRMTLAEKDRALTLQGSLISGAEEPRAELLRSS